MPHLLGCCIQYNPIAGCRTGYDTGSSDTPRMLWMVWGSALTALALPGSSCIRARSSAHVRAVDGRFPQPGNIILTTGPQLAGFDHQRHRRVDHDGQRERAVEDSERFLAVTAIPQLAARVAASWATNSWPTCDREDPYVTREKRVHMGHQLRLVVPKPAEPPLTGHQAFFTSLRVRHGEVADGALLEQRERSLLEDSNLTRPGNE